MSAYTGFGYDPEAVYQDADIEQAEWEAEGRALHAAQKAGRCCHTSTVGYSGRSARRPEQEGLRIGQQRCTEGCGRVFDSDEEWADAMEEAIHG